MIRRYLDVRDDDVPGALGLAARIIDESGMAVELQSRLGSKSGRGRRCTLPQYTVRAVLMTLFQLVYSGRQASITHVLTALWLGYTDEEMALLGLQGWRDSDRAERIRRLPVVHQNEYDRLATFIRTALKPIDDTPVKANKRATNATLRAASAQRTDAQCTAAALRDHLLNDLVAASVDRSLLSGAFKGHLAIDEHNVGMALFDHPTGTKPSDLHGGPALGGLTVKHRRLETAWAVGLTCAISSYQPGHPPVPAIALGIGFDAPSAASLPAALIAIDAADRHWPIHTLQPSQYRWVIGDKAYPNRNGMNAAIVERGRNLLMEYPANWNTTFDLWHEGEGDGPRLFNGVIICPGIPGDVLRRDAFKPISDNASPREVANRHRDLRRLQAATMPTNGRPRATEHHRRGRPSNDDSDRETVYKVKVQCPACCGKIRCPIIVESMTLDPAQHPMAVPPRAPATVCQQMNSTITIGEKAFKQYAPLMVGSFDHSDFYRQSRGRNEGFHGRLTSRTGGNLFDRSVTLKTNSGVALIIALAVAVTNLKEQAAWRQRITENSGRPPEGRRAALARARDASARRHTP